MLGQLRRNPDRPDRAALLKKIEDLKLDPSRLVELSRDSVTDFDARAD